MTDSHASHAVRLTGRRLTDNSALDLKARIRAQWVRASGLDAVRVLDAYHGDGAVWDEVRSRVDVPIVTVGVDLKPGKAGAVVRVDNRAALAGWDLDGFDVVDLDAYGWPHEQVAIVAERGFGGPVFVTRIAFAVGPVPAPVLEAVGIDPEWAKIAPGLFTSEADGLWLEYLGALGFRRAEWWVVPGGMGKWYGTIHL